MIWLSDERVINVKSPVTKAPPEQRLWGKLHIYEDSPLVDHQQVYMNQPRPLSPVRPIGPCSVQAAQERVYGTLQRAVAMSDRLVGKCLS